MSGSRRPAAAAAALALAAATAGCGIGAGEAAEGEASLRVTAGYGAEPMLESTIESPGASDTVLRALDREAEITTRYGGGFVQSIDGLAGGGDGGRLHDWFFYVNGIESPIGSAEVKLEAGDRVWWDHHDWTEVMRVPAVVGSYPQPFESTAGGTGGRVEVACAAAPEPCDLVAEALESAEVSTETVPAADSEPGELPRVLVGELEAIADDPAGALLGAGPERSGVFVRPEAEGTVLELLDERAAGERSGEHGLVAATARGDEAPTWIVTGTSADLVGEAAGLLDERRLDGHFALAVAPGGERIAVPVR